MAKSQLKPTIFGQLVMFFPALHVLVMIATTSFAFQYPAWFQPFIIMASVYLFPLLSHRLHDLVFPLVETRDIIPSGSYPPWWGSYHIQKIFLAMPVLEAPLRLIPGLFSFWLRLWGSKIGRGVYWPPLIEIADRSLLEIGHGTVLGHQSGYYCHVLNPSKDGRMLLLVKKIRIGNFCFIGSGSRLGPGVELADKTKLDVLTDLSIGGVKRETPVP